MRSGPLDGGYQACRGEDLAEKGGVGLEGAGGCDLGVYHEVDRGVDHEDDGRLGRPDEERGRVRVPV